LSNFLLEIQSELEIQRSNFIFQLNGKLQIGMDLKNAKVYEGAPEGKPSTTLTIADEDFMLMAQGKLQPQAAFMKGKLKITVNIMLAQKLSPILKDNEKF
jgi:putative sterol carrier protein